MLLGDIHEEFQNNSKSEYFIGSIVVNEKDKTVYEVVDGQQRLTTLFLILCVFRKMLSDSPAHAQQIEEIILQTDVGSDGKILNKQRLELQYRDTSDILKKLIDDNFSKNDISGPAQKIYEAFNTIEKYFNSDFKDKDELIRFYGYFANYVNFIQITTPDISDALKIFETINERGIGLNPLDLLKNLIFRNLNRDDFNKVNQEWKTITSLLEKNKQKPLRFLRYFLMANYYIQDKEGKEVITEDNIYRWISNNNDQCRYSEEPFGLVEKLTDNAEAYVNFARGENLSKRNYFLENLKFLGGGSFSQHLVLLLSIKELREGYFNHLIKQLEILIFYYTITRTSTKELESKFSKWANKLREIDINGDNLKEDINKFIEENFVPEISNMQKDFEIQFLNLRLDSLQNYKIKYILAKIAQFVDLQRLGKDEYESLIDYMDKKIEIEHILPNTPISDLIDYFGGKDKYEEYKNKLGNLTLLEKPINIVAGRSFFDNKKKYFESSKFYLTKSISKKDDVGQNTSISRTNEYLLSFDKWEDENIDKRQAMLFEIAKLIWKIELIK